MTAVAAPRPSPPAPHGVRFERHNAALVTAYAGCAGSVIAAVITGVTTLLAAPDRPSVPAKPSIAAIKPQDPCPSVAEQYRAELHREPAMMRALVLVASADPSARYCGIDARTLRLMLDH